MKRHELTAPPRASFVLPRWKAVYVSVPKAACTSMKWLVADLQDESRQRFEQTLSTEVARSMTVHRRNRWQHTPMLQELADANLEQITPENGWFVFGVVRHPADRLWSAWQSKFLLQDPRFVGRYPDAPWPRVPETTADVVEDFQAFVRAIVQNPEQPAAEDRHFRAQTRLLGLPGMPYTRIYRTSEIAELLEDLEKHLRPLGLTRMPELVRSNETPLRPVPSMFTPQICELVGRHYAVDFERFGYDETPPGSLSPADEYSADALGEIGRIVERSERIGDLHDIAAQWRAKNRRARRRLAKAKARARTQARAKARAQAKAQASARQNPPRNRSIGRRAVGSARRRSRAAVRRLRARTR